MSSTNVATILDHTGTVYAYTTRTDGVVRVTLPANGSASQTTLGMSNDAITKQAGIGVALAPPSTSNPAGARVVFSVDDNSRLNAFVDESNPRMQSLGLSTVKEFNSIGVASLLGGAMSASFTTSEIDLVIWGWDGLLGSKPKAAVTQRLSASDLGLGQVRVFPGSDDDNVSGSSVALTPFIDAQGVTRVFMVSTWLDSKGDVHVYGHVIEVATQTKSGVVTCTGMTLRSAGLDIKASKFASCPSVLQRPDGRLMVWFCDAKGIQQALVTPTSGLDWISNWTTLSGSGDVPALSKYDFPCAIAFAPGQASSSTSLVAHSLSDASVPVYDVIFAQAGDNIDAARDNNLWGTLRRTAQAPQPQQEILALGLIYGPPPVPLQNINMPAEYSNTITSGVVSFSQTAGSSSGMSANLGSSLFGKIGGSIGDGESVAILGFTIASYEVKAQAELSLGLSLMGTWSSTTSQSVTTTIQSTVSLAGHAGSSSNQPNAYTVQQNGQIIGLSSQWASYIYDFVDARGNAPANALSYVAVFPYQPALVLTPFTIPSYAEGPHPGDLSSYTLAEAQLNELDSKAHEVGGRPYLEVSWAVGGLSSQTAATYDESTWSVNLGLDFSAMLGASASANVVGIQGSVEGSATLAASFGYTWTGGSSSSAQFSSSVAVPGNTSAPGTYSAYGYRAYLIGESAQNLSALPAGTTGASGLQVSRDSKPWLITYALTSSSLV